MDRLKELQQAVTTARSLWIARTAGSYTNTNYDSIDALQQWLASDPE